MVKICTIFEYANPIDIRLNIFGYTNSNKLMKQNNSTHFEAADRLVFSGNKKNGLVNSFTINYQKVKANLVPS